MRSYPRWLALPAAAGAALLLVPLVSLLAQVPWGRLAELLTSETAVAALWVSLRTASVATLACVVLGVPLALVLARAGSGLWVRLLRALILLPLVLPPVVSGLALTSAFGRRAWLGESLEAMGVSVSFTMLAVILAQTFVGLPFLVLTVEGALRSQTARYESTALGLGLLPAHVWWRVTLPLLRPALAAGAVLAFARALGEFGATITFAGSLQGRTRTLPLEIYLQREADPDAAIALSVLLIAVALLVIGIAAGRRRNDA